jgi:hypothetical protein
MLNTRNNGKLLMQTTVVVLVLCSSLRSQVNKSYNIKKIKEECNCGEVCSVKDEQKILQGKETVLN